jgi:mycofactocin precursor
MLRQKETCMEKLDVEKDEKIKDSKKRADENHHDSIFDTEEIQIEEMAIDGICGVY